MEIGELEVFNTMKSTIVKLENHSHGVTIVMIDGFLAKEKICEEEMKINIGEFMDMTNTKIQQFGTNEESWDPTQSNIGGNNLLLFDFGTNNYLIRWFMEYFEVVGG